MAQKHLQAQVDDAIIHAGDLHVAAVRYEVWPHLVQRCIHCLRREIRRLALRGLACTGII